MNAKYPIVFVISFLSLSLSAQIAQKGPDIDGEAAGDQSGNSVSMSSDGSTVAIGAPSNNSATGHVRVYVWNGAAWQQKGTDIDGESTSDNSGLSVSMSSDGNTVAIGANAADGNAPGSGHVRVYAWDGTAWQQKGVDIDGDAASDDTGWSVSISADGNTVAIGDRLHDGNGSNAGRARVFAWDGTAWQQKGAGIDGEAADDQSGWAVSMSSDGNTIAVGAIVNDGINGLNSGHVRVYEWVGAAWQQKGSDIDGEAAGDQSGTSVSMSGDGNMVAIGATLNDGTAGLDSGHVRVYEWDGAAWQQRGTDIDGEVAGDFFGASVSVSSDGGTVAIGSRLNDGNGNNAGHARVYGWDGTAWQQIDTDIDGEAAGDTFGFSVSVNSDGSTVAIGGRLNDGNGLNAGHVRVFEIPTLGVGDFQNVVASIRLFPNPAGDVFTIAVANGTELRKISLYNALGALVLETSQAELSVNHLSEGMYIVKIETDKGSFTRKLVKN